jgi:hypothetical protein
MVGEVFSLKSFWTNRSTSDDFPTAASPEEVNMWPQDRMQVDGPIVQPGGKRSNGQKNMDVRDSKAMSGKSGRRIGRKHEQGEQLRQQHSRVK